VSYTATESDGSQPVCVTVHEPSNISIELEFNLSVKPMNGTAGMYVHKHVSEEQEWCGTHWPPDPTREGFPQNTDNSFSNVRTESKLSILRV